MPGSGVGDLNQLPPELLAALSAAASGGAGGMPGGLDPNMFSALAQLSNLSNNMQSDERSYSPNPNRLKSTKSNVNTPSNGSSRNNNNGKGTPSSSSRHQVLGKSSGEGSNVNSSGRKSSRPQHYVDDEDNVYQGLDLSRKSDSGRKGRKD